MEGPSSPLSPINPSGQEAKKSDIDKFIVWYVSYYYIHSCNCWYYKRDLIQLIYKRACIFTTENRYKK